MEKHSFSPSQQLTLSSLPENQELAIAISPSELKDRLIFGPTIDQQTSSTPKPPPPSSSTSNIIEDVDNIQQWLVDPLYDTTKKTNLHKSRTAPAMAAINDILNKHLVDPQQPIPTSQSIVRQAVMFLLLYLSFGIVIFCFSKEQFSGNETFVVVDALYFCIVTMGTIGYGDITPNSTTTKLFSVLFVLVGFGFIDILLSGMVTYVLDLQENNLIRAVKTRKDDGQQANSLIVDVKKGRMRIRMKVALALGVVVLCIGVGVCFMHFVEQLGWLDSLYLSVMSVTTVGYGDTAFNSLPGRIFASVWLLVSTLAVARAFLYLAEARVDKRNRRLMKWALSQSLTLSQFLAADIDNNGFVSKSEYIIYKLKEMGKISDKDILQICKKFEELDTVNCGRITLADLMHSHL